MTRSLLLFVIGIGAYTAAMPAQAQQPFIPVEGGDSLYFESVGEGPAVVLLHDGTFHSIIWDHQISSLSQHYRVIRYDRRGYGRSTRPDTSYWNTSDLAMVLDGLEVSEAVLIGSSAGGRLAAEYAIIDPKRVVGLVLIGAMVPGLAHAEQFVEDAWSRVDPLLNADRTAVLDPIPDAAREEVVRRYIEDRYFVSQESPAARGWIRRNLSEHFDNILNPTRWMKWPDPPLLERLGEITVPTLVVVGENDHPELHANAGAFQISLPRARRVVVAGAAHLPQLERPDEVNRLLLEFLEEQVLWSAAGAANVR